MSKLQAIPRSNAKTAWGLCQDVIRAIKKDPKRADMAVFGATLLPQYGGPACGTIGCLAGWICRLAGKPGTRANDIVAKHIIDPKAQLDYFTVGPQDFYVFNAGDGDRCETTPPSSRAHAHAVVTRMKKFMRINETKLKAQRIAV